MKKSIAVLLTVFNRKEKTLECIKSVKRQEGLESFASNIFLVDGGSSDRTPEEVQKIFPEVHVSVHDGLYWAEGMRQAWKNALAYSTDFDYFWLINDDTTLYPTCLKLILETESIGNELSTATLHVVPFGVNVTALFASVPFSGSFDHLTVFSDSSKLPVLLV